MKQQNGGRLSLNRCLCQRIELFTKMNIDQYFDMMKDRFYT